MDSPITRLLDDPEKNAQRWKKLTDLADYEDAGAPKPGATILASLSAGRRKLPLLITETYGHGRTAVLATGGTWRWQMSEALGDPSHDLFWHQLLRWLVADTPGPVVASMPARILMDEGRAQLKARVYDRQFQPAADAHVTAHIVGPEGVNAFVDLTSSQDAPGTYQLDWTAEKPGAYLAEIAAESAGNEPHELGRDVVTFQREDGVAEKFHTSQNRPFLEQLASQTGGRYWKPTDLKNLPRDISYSEAGISVRNTKELWNMPIVFALLMGLPASEWLLRRKWGVDMTALCCWRFSLRGLLSAARGHRTTSSSLAWGEPDYQQRFTAEAKDLDRVLRGSGESAHVYTLSGAQSTASQLRETLSTVARDAKAEDDFVLNLHRPRLVRWRRIQVQSRWS